MPVYTDDGRRGLPRPLTRNKAMTEWFGPPGDDHLTTVRLPVLDRPGSVHRRVADAYVGVFSDIRDLGLPKLVDVGDYGGTYCYRTVRGSSALSPHSWGVAMDLNVSQVRQGGKDVRGPGTNYHCKPDQVSSALTELSRVFFQWGFTWGGIWAPEYLDPMHFEATDVTCCLLEGRTCEGYDLWQETAAKAARALPSSTVRILHADGRLLAEGYVGDDGKLVTTDVRALLTGLGHVVNASMLKSGNKVYVR